jgi:hypothetical protein
VSENIQLIPVNTGVEKSLNMFESLTCSGNVEFMSDTQTRFVQGLRSKVVLMPHLLCGHGMFISDEMREAGIRAKFVFPRTPEAQASVCGMVSRGELDVVSCSALASSTILNAVSWDVVLVWFHVHGYRTFMHLMKSLVDGQHNVVVHVPCNIKPVAIRFTKFVQELRLMGGKVDDQMDAVKDAIIDIHGKDLFKYLEDSND